MRFLKLLAACPLIAISMLAAESALAQQGGAFQGGGFQSGPMAEAAAIRGRIQQRSYTFEPTGQKLPYAVFLPRTYSKKKAMPLIVVLHGLNAPPESIITSFGTAADKHGYILVAPVGYTLAGWYGVPGMANAEIRRYSEQDVMNVLALARAEFNIDPRRIYIAGHSMGGVGAAHIAAAHPEIWAAAGVMSAAGAGTLSQRAEGLGRLPIIVQTGEKDELVPVESVRDWVESLKEREAPTQYYEYKGGTHTAPMQGGAERALQFFNKHSRPADQPAP